MAQSLPALSFPDNHDKAAPVSDLKVKCIIFMTALFCGICYFVLTRSGIGIGGDTNVFSDTAINLLRGRGFVYLYEPMVHFPPLFPIILAVLQLNLTALKILHTMVLIANVYCFAWMLHQAGVRLGVLIPFALTFGLQSEILWLHSVVMTEPIFLLFAQLTIIALADRRFILAIAFASLSSLQRYSGIVIVGLVPLLSLWLVNGNFPRRLAQATGYGLLTAAPIGAWMFRNLLIGGTIGRYFGTHTIESERLAGLPFVIIWFLPLTVAISLVFAKYPELFTRRPIPNVVRICAALALLYVAFIVITVFFFDQSTPLNQRILLPILPCGWLILAYFSELALRRNHAFLKAFVTAMIALTHGISYIFVVPHVVTIWLLGTRGHSELTPELIEVVTELPPETQIYTNDPPLVWLAGYSLPESLPLIQLPYSQQPNLLYQDQINHIVDKIIANEAIVIWFSDGKYNLDNQFSNAELSKELQIRSFDNISVVKGKSP